MEIISHIEIRDGQAVLRDHNHLKAKMIARKHLWEGFSIEEVMQHYGLTAAEVHSAIAYYYDNQAELDAEYEQTLAEMQSQGITLEELKAKRQKR